MNPTLKTISPVDGRVYVERALETAAGIDRALDLALRAQRAWSATPLDARCALLGKAVDAFVAKASEIAPEISWQMGRPIRHAPGEVRGFEERARYMLQVAPEALAAITPAGKPGFERQIKRVPLGVVAVVAPWNYPYLTAVNAVLPALIAGNAVILKHSHQTPLCAERFLEAFAAAGLPVGVFQYLHLSHDDTARLMGDRRVAGVCFTGSVSGGKAVVAATAAGFANSGLELGGKDPAYVRIRRQSRPCDRFADRRRVLQCRPVLLRHQAHLCRRAPLRRIRRGRRRADPPISAREPARSGNDARPRRARVRRGRGARPSARSGRQGAQAR